ncbi:MAG: ribonuclease P protein component [Candidatus Doudnabacteria bacterium RIFCSPLOWO2_02_FULL_42_9]|uniref:Ribonuclease P protein component n=1 Tax=Candidatus Doudnabacteria bacterium RIFCSPHIGHO2_01_FULL_41_86 TaxID=1817821 RepID=A0A1F5N8N1_9BACT|nr:MAG: ribonuclease P protein component [Candidatus Doudnabacteria bacterium RIFCSPHIGHO2_01_FULL_41_86]OGE75108.1 MAG: ribonuclease P protein component [Candidatus Doudnabacteria bacterium RIFCSPHIGHO2_01_43_10]OGE86369.1 MAG: ribonuclease P protein component [Candidatus Doudnabacteria bacterium RIFCSPHIGHO2_12_FULL_42_22]OGE87368.1 MAG: ribonuclease P protein component [Candidatus Doudnabacteria bacterium RIFCSPHIGHO2_02_FULL_42_25]OGE92666.1 MAG: ribonuclease P protein component [Candidatus
MLKFLKDDKDFAAFRTSKSFQNRFLKIRVRYALNQNIPRFGFIIPKKVMPKVVDRNKVKRRIKSILVQSMSKVKGADVIFYPQKGLLKQDFQTLTHDVHELFTKARLWK